MNYAKVKSITEAKNHGRIRVGRILTLPPERGLQAASTPEWQWMKCLTCVLPDGEAA